MERILPYRGDFPDKRFVCKENLPLQSCALSQCHLAGSMFYFTGSIPDLADLIEAARKFNCQNIPPLYTTRWGGGNGKGEEGGGDSSMGVYLTLLANS